MQEPFEEAAANFFGLSWFFVSLLGSLAVPKAECGGEEEWRPKWSWLRLDTHTIRVRLPVGGRMVRAGKPVHGD